VAKPKNPLQKTGAPIEPQFSTLPFIPAIAYYLSRTITPISILEITF
jgi:hypothetical protein